MQPADIMKRHRYIFYLLIAGIFLSFSIQAQDFAFKTGEKLTYAIGYKAMGIYINAGSATFSVARSDTGTVCHFIGEGATNSAYDWIFKVRDRYESFFDTVAMQSVKAIRSVSEGKYKKYEEVVFDQKNNIAVTKKGKVKVPENIQDVISSIYYMRSINFSRYKKADTIPFNMFFGHQVYRMYVQYVGKETIKTDYGTFSAIKIQPMLLKGDTFKSEDDMQIWITDDKNHIPLRIESKLKVGSIKVDLSGYQNLRYPFNDKRKK